VAHIFENGAFTWGTEGKTIGKTFFGRDFYERYHEKIRSLRLMDCYREGNFKSLRDFADMGLPIKMNTWLCLSGVAKKAIRKYKKADPLAESKREELRSFLLRLKKGSKKIRKILDSETVNNAQPTSLRIVESFAEITSTLVPPEKTLTTVLSTWNNHYFTNDFREFLFKQRNNTLGVGARVAHFDENVDERCTFCRLLYPPTRTREDFIHLFRTCPITVGIIRNLILRSRIAVPVPRADPDPDFENLFWYGLEEGETKLELVIFFDLLRFVLWKFKTRRVLPRINEFFDIFTNMLDTILAIKQNLRILIFNNRLIANILQALG
jgi:hypothetical protein